MPARPTGIAVALVVAVLLAVQLVSDGLYGELAVVPSVPHALAGTWPFALVAGVGLDRIPAVRENLARAAIARGDDRTAAALLDGVGAGPTADDLRGRLALAQGDAGAALRAFAEAGDYAAAAPLIDALAQRDPLSALRIVRRFDALLGAELEPPETTALVEWREGQLAAAVSERYPDRAAIYGRESLDAYRRALARAPDEETYLLAYGFQTLVAGDARTSLTTYQRAAQVVPDSVDAFVGVAAASAVLGDCPAARTALARGRRFAAAQHRAAAPRADGYAEPVLAALVRCGA